MNGKDARRDEKDAQKAKAWDLWLDCASQKELGDASKVDERTIRNWLDPENSQFIGKFPVDPPGQKNPGDPKDWGNVQHFDVWNFQKADGKSSYFWRPWAGPGQPSTGGWAE